MIDIRLFDSKENFGFSKVYTIKIIRIKKANELKKLDNELNIVEGGMFNRKILENRKVDVLVSPEKIAKNDYLHYRNSGLNHVLCKLAKKNNIAIGLNFNDVLHSKGEERARLLGRMMQNVRLCRKYRIMMIFASFARNFYDMRG